MDVSKSFLADIKVVVLIPCYNEEITIGSVVRDFRAALPNAPIYVYDNNSTDQTVKTALAAGAIVRSESLQGKGYVIRRMFSDIEADFYILVDGDATYEAAAAPEMLKTAYTNGLDMVNGARVTDRVDAYRRGHVLGNKVLTGLVTSVFGRRLSDMLSGYRVFRGGLSNPFPPCLQGLRRKRNLPFMRWNWPCLLASSQPVMWSGPPARPPS